MNADDFYGADSYRLLFDHLAGAGETRLVGYTLRETRSEQGGVSRAIAELTHRALSRSRKSRHRGRGDSGLLQRHINLYVLLGASRIQVR